MTAAVKMIKPEEEACTVHWFKRECVESKQLSRKAFTGAPA
jgi:hypothetical protein